MKQVAGTLRLELAQYREKAAFAQFGSDLDKATQFQLARGERLTELLKQPQYKPMPVVDQIVSIFAGTRGALDDLPTSAVRKFEEEFLAFIRAKHGALHGNLNKTRELSKEMQDELMQAVSEFKAGFKP